MTSEEVMLLKTLIREKIDVFGKCHILSEGQGCTCALCQIDRMDNEDLRVSVESLLKNGYDINRPFLSDQIKRDTRCKGCSWEPDDSGCNTRFGTETCKMNRTL